MSNALAGGCVGQHHEEHGCIRDSGGCVCFKALVSAGDAVDIVV